MNLNPPAGRATLFRRIVGPSLFLLFLGMLLASLVQSRQTKSLVLDAVGSESEKVLTATNASLNYVMLRADAEGLQTTLDRVAASNDIRRLYVLDLEGNVYRSSEKGREAALPPGLMDGVRGTDLFVSDENDGGRGYLRSVQPVINEADCSTCHGQIPVGGAVGYLGVDRWTDEAVSRGNAVQAFSAGVNLVLLICMGLTLAFLVRRVTGPLGRVTAVAERFSTGDFDMEGAEARASDPAEIQVLSQAFSGVGRALGGVSEEAKKLVGSARAGQLSDRADETRFPGTFRELVGGLNEMMSGFEESSQVVRQAADYLERISAGDIPPVVTESYEGDFRRVRDGLNQVIRTMEGLASESGKLISSARAGDLDARAREEGFRGAWAELLGGMNGILEAFLTPSNAAFDALGKAADGDLTARVEGEWPGAYGEIKAKVNGLIERMDQGFGQVAVSADQVASAAEQISSRS